MLTLLLALSGGASNGFIALLLLPVAMSAVLLPAPAAYLSALLAIALYNLLLQTGIGQVLEPMHVHMHTEPFSQHMYYSFETGHYVSHVNLIEQQPSYHYDALQNVRQAMKYAKANGFTHCIISDGDNILDKDDLKKFLDQIDYAKKALFYRVAERKLNAFSSLIYFSEIDFFLEKMNYETKHSYVERSKEIGEYTLEKHYHATFSLPDVKVLYANEYNLTDIFSHSRMDVLTSSDTPSSINICKSKYGEEIFYFAYSVVGKLKIWAEEELVAEINVNRLEGWEYGSLNGAEEWKGTIRIEHLNNGVTRHIEMDQEIWKRHLSLNYIQFYSNI
jgi:hypothetical protein